MKCRHLFSFALVLFLSFFFGSFIITSDTFAVDDYTITVLPNSSPLICSDLHQDYPNCSDYDYIIFTPNNSSADTFFRVGVNGVILRVSTFFNTIFSIDSYNSLNISAFESGADSITVTLTNSLPDSSTLPSGNIDITSNGTYDVTNYAQATVNVPSEVIQGDYHDDLVNIQKSIIVCGAILLVLYFFYCIYRLIIKNSGVY